MLWLFYGIVVGMVLVLTLLNPEKGIREWIARYWARMVSLVTGVSAIIGVIMGNTPMALSSALILTVLVFRGYDQEIEEEVIEEEVPAKKETIIADKIIKQIMKKAHEEEVKAVPPVVNPPLIDPAKLARKTVVDLDRAKVVNGKLVIDD